MDDKYLYETYRDDNQAPPETLNEFTTDIARSGANTALDNATDMHGVNPEQHLRDEWKGYIENERMAIDSYYLADDADHNPPAFLANTDQSLDEIIDAAIEKAPELIQSEFGIDVNTDS